MTTGYDSCNTSGRISLIIKYLISDVSQVFLRASRSQIQSCINLKLYFDICISALFFYNFFFFFITPSYSYSYFVSSFSASFNILILLFSRTFSFSEILRQLEACSMLQIYSAFCTDYKGIPKLAPQFTKTPVSVIAFKGETVGFCARVQCGKPMEIVWTINGKDVRGNSRCKVRPLSK